MDKQTKPSSPPAKPPRSQADDDLIHQFQTYLGAVISAKQTDRTELLESLPGRSMPQYCRMLVELRSPEISADEILDLAKIVNRWRRLSDPVSIFLWQRLSAPEKALLTNYQPSTPEPGKAQVVILQLLNKIIAGPCIYEEARFQSVSLRSQTVNIMNDTYPERDPAHVNRLLLEDAYPVELKRDPNWPGSILGWELAKPGLAIFDQIRDIAMGLCGSIRQNMVNDPAEKALFEGILEELDLYLAFMLRQLFHFAKIRAQVTRSSDLLLDVFSAAIDGGVNAAQLVRRYHQLRPEEAAIDRAPGDESLAEDFAWDTYQRVAALDKLADEFPDYVKMAARRMDAWPMLRHRHTNNRRRFNKLAKRLELGAEYPFDATEGARFRPDTPLVRYLTPLVHRLHDLWCGQGRRRESLGEHASAAEEQESIAHGWWEWPEENPSAEVLEILRAVAHLPPLTKSTAHSWAKIGLVPLILATDAREWNHCPDPALQSIAKQKGVKSQATFKSRLLAAVSAALQRLAREA